MTAKDFKLQLDKEWLATQEDIADVVSGIGLEALRRVVLKSPVDTGRFKGNWDVSIGAISATYTENVDPSGAETIARGQAVLQAYPDDRLVPLYLQNNLPYADVLEDGWSGQAPSGVLAVTVAELEAMFASVDV